MIKFLIVLGISFFNPPQDSIGIEIINGKKFIVHQVTQGETLYGISKRYGVTVDQILEFNSTADAGLEIGQILKIPYIPRTTAKSTDGIIHKVAEHETLFSISKMYDVTVYELREWNSLPDNSLSVGQELIIRKKKPAQNSVKDLSGMMSTRTVHTVQQGETLYSLSKQYGVTVQQLREWNNLSATELSVGQQLFVAQPMNGSGIVPKQQDVVVSPPVDPIKVETDSPKIADTNNVKATDTSSTIVISESVQDSDEVVESGLAELIEGTEGSRKYLALHRTAPVGTILKIKNQMNNREVFVRVVGKLPDIAQTKKLVIKISKSAYDRLGAIDPRFMVEVTYYK